MSGDDCAPDVLGYADSGEFDEKNIPSNMKAWLQGYADEIKWMKEHDVKTSHLSTRGSTKNYIAPLISTRWDQKNPYNLQCPNFFTYGKCVTGCVATAMAQVLYHLGSQTGFPSTLKNTIPGYDCTTNWTGLGKIHVDQINGNQSFDWANMTATYTGQETAGQSAADAVAFLMSCCGASVTMEYRNSDNGGSSASLGSIPAAFRTYFGFDNSVAYKERSNFTTDEWEDIIYHELACGRPVIYGGQSSGGGHAFVCDGYDENRYFHINWGWSGNHNGNFLLSALNPRGTGSGGSTSADGYSMDQSAVIGIQAPTGDDSEESCVLSVKTFKYTGNPEQTVTSNNPSIPINFDFSFSSAMSYTHSVVFSLGVFSGSDMVSDCGIFEPIEWDAGVSWGSNDATCYLNTNLMNDNQTYQIRPVCRFEGSQEWKELLGADYYYLNATKSGDKVSIENVNPVIDLTAGNFVLTTNGLVNTIQTIRVDITNKSGSPFHDNLYMFVDGTKVSGNGVNVESGQTVAAYFSFKPTSASTKAVKITTDEQGEKIIRDGESSVTITGPASVSGLSLDGFTTNGSSHIIYGNTFKAIISVTNSGSEDYTGGFAARLYKMTSNDSGPLIAEIANDRHVAAGKTEDICFEFKDLEYGQSYFCFAGYYSGEDFQETSDQSSYTMTRGIMAIDANGDIISATDPEAQFTVPENTSVVDLRGLNTVTSVITTSASPNCLYLLDEGATVPTGLSKNNVVKGNTAETIELTDGYDFYSPIDFKATKITYTRQFTGYNTENNQGWSTISLPFAVSRITCEEKPEKPLDWFHSESDTGKNFWLMAFSNDGPDNVNFDYASSFEANTPYIITVPGNTWGDEWNLAGKNIIFTGEDVTVRSNPKAVVTGSNYKFYGSARKQNLQNVFVLNTEGDYFERKSSAQEVDPFRAYFDVVTYTNFTSSFSIGFNKIQPTALFNIKRTPVEDINAVYNLQGIKVGTTDQKSTLPKGIYIINKKKVIIK